MTKFKDYMLCLKIAMKLCKRYFIVIYLIFLINNHMYLALQQKSSMRILDMKIFKPIKGCKMVKF